MRYLSRVSGAISVVLLLFACGGGEDMLVASEKQAVYITPRMQIQSLSDCGEVVPMGVGPAGPRDPTDPPIPDLPDFLVESAKIFDDRYTFLQTETLRVHTIIGNEGDANWFGPRDDMYVMLLLSEGSKEDSHSEWRNIGMQQIKKGNINVGDHKDEYFTVNLATLNQGLPLAPGTYNFVVCADRKETKDNGDGEVLEKHKSNNCSTELVFEVLPDPHLPLPDFIISAASVIGTAQPVPAGGPMGGRMAIRNIGLVTPSSGVRSSYAVCDADGITNCVVKADDGSDAGQLTPGRDQWEETLSLFTAPYTPGAYTLRVCANYLGSVAESNPSNNCQTVSFAVVSAVLDLTISAIGAKDAKTRIKKDSKVETELSAKNIGNVSVGSFEYICYYRVNGGSWKHYATKDMGGLKPGEERRGTCKELKFNQRGTWEILGLVDSLAQFTESNKANNWVLSQPITVY